MTSSFWQTALVTIIPGLIWLWFFYRQDAYEPEPKHLLLFFFGLGMLAVLPALLLESPWQPYLQSSLRSENLLRLALMSFVVVGIVEEGAKFAVLYFVLLHLAEFDEPLDGIIYGVTVGLGFATLENILFALGMGPTVGFIRAILPPLAHASFSGWLGYFLSLAKYKSKKKLIWLGFLLAVLLHGGYDLPLLHGVRLAGLLSILLVGAAMFLLLRKMHELESISPFHPAR